LTWEFPGGSAVAGESSRKAAARELREEAGLDVAADSVRFVDRFVESAALVDLYVATVSDHLDLELDPVEIAGAEWVSIDEARARLAGGATASPWRARVDALWDPLVHALDCQAGVDQGQSTKRRCVTDDPPPTTLNVHA